MAKSATIRSVAARAGVSVTTVSRVLNNHRNVSDEARGRVLAAVEALGFRPSLQARGMRARSSMIGLMVGDLTPPFAVEVELAAAARCRAEGCHLVLGAVGPDRDAAGDAVAELIAAVKLDGLILYAPIADDPRVIAVVQRAGTPCARLSTWEVEGAPAVRIDDRAAAAAMTRHLLGLGHRRIALIMGPPHHRSSRLRFQGYRDALEATGLALEPQIIVEGDYFFASGLARGGELLRLNPPPTAIFASNDDMAIGVIAAAKAARIRVPGDVSVAGFDDIGATSVWPPLTTVRQPVRDMAEAAIDIVFRSIGRRGKPQSPGHRVLDATLVVRGSTAAVG